MMWKLEFGVVCELWQIGPDWTLIFLNLQSLGKQTSSQLKSYEMMTCNIYSINKEDKLIVAIWLQCLQLAATFCCYSPNRSQRHYCDHKMASAVILLLHVNIPLEVLASPLHTNVLAFTISVSNLYFN
jgi:hypothetical protein